MDFIIKYVLPIVYTILLAWLLQRNKTFKQNGFAPLFIVLFFIAKCVSGITYAYISIKYIPKGGDIPLFYGDGLELYKTFMQSPAMGFQRLNQMFSFKDADILNSHSSFIRSVFEGIKLIYFLLDFFSFGNLYTDTILFNGFAVYAFLQGGVFLKRHLKSKLPFIWFFLMPSAFFYTSCIFKEGLVFILICFILPLVYKMFTSFRFSNLILFAPLFFLLFFFKFLIAVTFLGVLVLWWMLLRFPAKRKIIVIAFLAVGVFSFFSIGKVFPKLDMAQNIVHRQKEFLELDAHSKITVPHLEPTFCSFLISLPAALNNVLFKPLPDEGGKIYYVSFSFEIFIFWGMILFIWKKNNWKINLRLADPLVWSLFIFAIANLITIGYTVSNIGAITRYRSIFLPFIGLFFWSVFDGNRLLSLQRKNF